MKMNELRETLSEEDKNLFDIQIDEEIESLLEDVTETEKEAFTIEERDNLRDKAEKTIERFWEKDESPLQCSCGWYGDVEDVVKVVMESCGSFLTIYESGCDTTEGMSLEELEESIEIVVAYCPDCNLELDIEGYEEDFEARALEDEEEEAYE